MMAVLQWLHTISALIVLAEALNKLERTCPCSKGLTPHARLVDGLKALAWALLALGGGCAVIKPLLLANGIHAAFYLPLFDMGSPLIDETAVMAGFAVLIVRTRVKEG